MTNASYNQMGWLVEGNPLPIFFPRLWNSDFLFGQTEFFYWHWQVELIWVLLNWTTLLGQAGCQPSRRSVSKVLSGSNSKAQIIKLLCQYHTSFLSLPFKHFGSIVLKFNMNMPLCDIETLAINLPFWHFMWIQYPILSSSTILKLHLSLNLDFLKISKWNFFPAALMFN